MATIVSPASADDRPAIARDGAIAVAAAVLFLALHAMQGFPTLADGGGDNDSLLRLVQVRDLIAGQGWFDLTQYRMGLEGGFPMHWSRLVDLPIAAIILAVGSLGGMALGETVALIAWPLALFGLSLFLIVRTARLAGGDWAVLPAAVVGGLALYFVNIFAPGALDHHNLQLVLALATMLCLVRAPTFWPAAAMAGVCAALMLAVGMEAAPYVAVAGATMAISFLIVGRQEARATAAFGAAFAAVAALALVATVPVGDWFAAHCDAYSLPQWSLAVVGGLGLLMAAAFPSANASRGRRIVVLGAVGAAMAILALALFPQCLSDPYSGVDPRLKRFWLSAVTEARPITTIIRSDPAMFAGFYVTPLLALVVLGWRIVRGNADRNAAIFVGFLAVAVLVSFWQVRGAMFSIPFAAIPLAIWIGERRRCVAEAGTAGLQVAMVAAWLASISVVWQLAATTGIALADRSAEEPGSVAEDRCYRHSDYETLAGLPQGTVLAISNLGSSILRETPHRALAGPYHRNVAGNLATLDMLMGDSAEAEAIARRNGVDYVVACRGNSETKALTTWAEDGLLAAIMQGKPPSWLVPVTGMTGQSLEIYMLTSRQAR